MTSIEERILRDFKYNPDTGVVIRVNKKILGYENNVYGYHSRVVNEIAGTKCHGYMVTTICDNDSKKYRFANHRIAFLFMTGSFPEKYMDVDHINGIKDDNRWCNLRLAKRGQNNMNSGSPKNNTSGQKGVHKNRDKGWYARIKVDQKIIHLGCFENFEDAVSARKEAEEKYFGDFRRI